MNDASPKLFVDLGLHTTCSANISWEKRGYFGCGMGRVGDVLHRS